MATTTAESSARIGPPSRGSQFIEEDTGAHATANSAGKQTALGVPASEPNLSSSTDLSGATASDPAESIGRGSKRSLRGRGRAGSNASSKRSQNAAAAQLNEKSSRPLSSGVAQSTQPRAKKKSKFLSFLCCGGPDESTELNQQEPARQSTAAPSAQAASQPSSSKAPIATPGNTTDNTTTPMDEKATSPAYASNGPSAPVLSEKEKAPADNMPIDNQSSRLPELAQPNTYNRGDESALASERNEPPRLDTASQLPNPSFVVQAPTPGGAQDEDQIISDRTPEQQARDTDIEMTDVGPSIPLSANDVAGTSEEDSHPIQNREAGHYVDLPPPPPLEERQAQIAPVVAATTSQDTSLVPSPAETQKWLLPAMRPEHKGRKCLVLDLDETLVHSSFKVWKAPLKVQDVWLTCSDPPPSRLHNPSRNRGTIS